MKSILAILIGISLGACAQKSHKKDIGYKGHGGDSVSAEDIKKFAPRPLDPQKMSRIESFLDIRAPGGGLVSPDGKQMFFTWSVSGTRQIWKLSGKGSFPVQMTGGQDGSRLHQITPDGRFLVITRDQKGNEYPYLYLQSTSGGALRLVAGKKKVISSPQFVSDDSKYLYYTMNDSSPTLHSLYRYEISTGKSSRVFEGLKGYMGVADRRPSGDLLLYNATGSQAREYYLFNLNSKKLTPLLGQGEKQYYSMQFARKKGEYLVRTNKLSDFQKLYLWKGGKFNLISKNTTYNISGFQIDKTRSRILLSLNKDGYTEVEAMSATTYKKINVPFLKGNDRLHIFSGQTTQNGRFTLFQISKHNQPSTSFVYDWRRKVANQWVLPSSPEVNTRDFVRPQLEYYTARDGTKIPMFVRRPKKCLQSLCPVVVSFHGGPEAQARPYFSPFAQLFMEQGFVYAQPNVRGSSGYGKAWLDSDNGPKRLEVITDIEDAALFIKKNWVKNGQAPKVAVMGGSYGGYSTNVAMTLFAGAYDAGISIVGMSDLSTFLKNTGPFRRHLRVTEYGDPVKDKEALEKLSPVNYLDRLKDPLLVIHGATDPRVPAGEALQIYRAMEKKGLEGELILFADEGHGIRKRKNRAIYIGRVLEFLNKHLK